MVWNIYFLNAQIWCDLIFINSTKNTYFLVQENIVSMNLQISKYCSKFGVGKIFTFFIYKSPTQCCMHLIKTTIKINYNNHLNIFIYCIWIYFKMYLFLLWQSWIFSIITPVFRVTWSFRKHSNMLICTFAALQIFLINVLINIKTIVLLNIFVNILY